MSVFKSSQLQNVTQYTVCHDTQYLHDTLFQIIHFIFLIFIFFNNVPELVLLLKPLLFFLQVPALPQHHVLPVKQPCQEFTSHS